MERSPPPYEQLIQEDCIDIEISSATISCCSKSSPPQHVEFEFQMSAAETETLNSPADELFYKGKLLPLQLPPRLQMVRNLLLSSTAIPRRELGSCFDLTISTTPFESCIISPVTSCYVSGELSQEEHSIGTIRSRPKKFWSKKLKSIKRFSLSAKWRASKSYFKSLFTQSGCSDESVAIPNHQPMTREIGGHRRSFTGAIKQPSLNKSFSIFSSSSSSNSSSFSSGTYGKQELKRSSSVNSEVESSIQGAIAYCKKSQQLLCARKSASDVGLCTVSAARIAAECEEQERPETFQTTMETVRKNLERSLC